MNSDMTVQLVERFQDDQDKEKSQIVVETCQLAADFVKWSTQTDQGKTENLDLTQLKFRTNDPAPPFNYKENVEYQDIANLKTILLDSDKSLFERYRALFTLRELYTKESCEAICSTLLVENFQSCGALLKHEVAFVLAQMENTYSVAYPFLLECCQNPDESPIVKHEGLVAVGEMIEDPKLIEHLTEHPDPIVSESCLVALNNMKNRA